MAVAEPAVAAAQEHPALSNLGEIGEHGLAILRQHLGPDRHAQHDIAPTGAAALAPGAAAPVLRPEMLLVAVVDQGVEIIERLENDIAALAAIAAVGTAELDEFLAPEAGRAGAAIAALQVDLALVEKFHRGLGNSYPQQK